MTLSTDVYLDRDATVQEVGEAHGEAVEARERHWVDFRNYSADEDEGAVCSPFGGPSRDAGMRVDRESHG